MAKIDLQNSHWCQIVFDGRNKEYGAYALRKQYSGHTLRALVIAILAFGFCSYAPILPSIIGKKHAGTKIIADPITTLTTVDVNQPEKLPTPPTLPKAPPAVKEIRYTAPEVVRTEDLNPEDIPPPR